MQWRIQGGEPGARPPKDQNFLNFMQFLGKSGKFLCWRPLGVGAPSYGESRIRPWHVILPNFPKKKLNQEIGSAGEAPASVSLVPPLIMNNP